VPAAVPARRREVVHVTVRRRRLVGEVDDLVAAGVGRRQVEEVDEREARENPAATVGAGGDRGVVEVAGDREQQRRLLGVEHHLLAVLVEDGQDPVGVCGEAVGVHGGRR